MKHIYRTHESPSEKQQRLLLQSTQMNHELNMILTDNRLTVEMRAQLKEIRPILDEYLQPVSEESMLITVLIVRFARTMAKRLVLRSWEERSGAIIYTEIKLMMSIMHSKQGGHIGILVKEIDRQSKILIQEMDHLKESAFRLYDHSRAQAE